MEVPNRTRKKAAGSGSVADLDIELWPEAKRAVYDAAVQLFFERGYEATGVQEIVDAAGLTKGAMYHYFGSKEMLLQVTYERFLDMLLPALGGIRDRGLPAAEALGIVMRLMFDTVASYPREIVIFFEEWRHLSKKSFISTKAKRENIDMILTDI